MQNNAENSYPHKEATYHEFVRWFAAPTPLRNHLGIKDQNDFAAQFKVSKDTLSRWKKRSDFVDRVRGIRKEWGREKTANVILAIYNSALSGSTSAQRIWMEYFSGFDLKEIRKQNKDSSRNIILSTEDIDYMVNYLPEFLRLRYRNLIKNLLDDIKIFVEDDLKMTEEEYDEMMRKKEEDNEFL